MSLSPGSFRPEEISDVDAVIRDGELAAAYAAARSLEQAMPVDHVRLSPDFADRVMAAVAAEPLPRAAGFLYGVFARPGPASLVASIREAWSTAAGASGRPFGVRAAALAYVFVVLVAAVSVTGAAALGTAGAFGLLSDDGSAAPTEVIASPTTEPSHSAEPSSSPEPSESAEPSESPDVDESTEPSETPTSKPVGGPGTTPLPTPSDDDGGGASASPSDDHGGSETGSPTDSPRPSDTPKPSETPG